MDLTQFAQRMFLQLCPVRSRVVYEEDLHADS